MLSECSLLSPSSSTWPQKKLGVVGTASKPGSGPGKTPERTQGRCTGMLLLEDEKIYLQSQISFSRGFFHGSHIQAVQPSFSRLHGHHTHQKEEGTSSIVKGKGPERFIKQALGHWKECGLHLIPLESRRGNVRINQRTCTLYSEGCKLNMPGFPHLSDS